jgi:hypothetical protein
MFKQSKPLPSVRQSRRQTPKRSRGLYYNSLRSNNSEEVTRRRPITAQKKLGLWKQLPSILAVIIIIGCVIYELGLSTDPKIIIEQNPTSKAATFLQPSAVYEHAAQKLLSNSITSRTKLTIDTSSIAGRLQEQFAELEDVSITWPLLGHRPIIYLTSAGAALVLATQSSGTFALSDTGQALRQLASTSQLAALKLPVVTDQSGLAIAPGHIALPQSEVNFIELVSAQLSTAHFSIQSLLLPAASGELDVHLNGLAYFVKFNIYNYSSAKQQIGTFLATEDYLKGKSITPSQYIDARVPGRAYYQ